MTNKNEQMSKSAKVQNLFAGSTGKCKIIDLFEELGLRI